MSVMCEIAACELMCPACHAYYYECAQRRCAHYGNPLRLEQVEIAQQRDARRHKEKSEVTDKEIGHPRDMPQTYHLALQSSRQQQHADDARRDRNPGEPYHKLSRSEEKENDCMDFGLKVNG